MSTIHRTPAHASPHHTAAAKLAAHAKATRPGTQTVQLAPGFAIQTLANGAQLVEDVKPKSTDVQLQVGTRAGALEDPKGKDGAAHLFEHLAFEGTPTRSGAAIRADEHAWGNQGNAETTLHHVMITNTVPAVDGPQAARMMVDQYTNGDQRISGASLAKQKAIVEQEMNYRFGTPVQQAADEEDRLLYGSQPLGRDPIGTRASVDKVSTKDVAQFHQRWFTGANTVALVDGNVSAKTIAAVRARLAKLPKGSAVSEPQFQGFQHGVAVEAVPDKGNGSVATVTVDVPVDHQDPASLVAATIAGERLTARMREQDHLTYGITTDLEPAAGGDGAVLTMTTKLQSADVRRGVREIAKTLESLPGSITTGEVRHAEQENASQLALDPAESGQDAATAAFTALQGSPSVAGAVIAAAVNEHAAALGRVPASDSVTQVQQAAHQLGELNNVKVIAAGGVTDAKPLTQGLHDADKHLHAKTVHFDPKRYSDIAGRT